MRDTCVFTHGMHMPLATMNAKPLLLACLLALGAQAQTLQQPALPSVPMGTGAGVHSPDSPFAPLPKRSDVVPWSLLTDVQTKADAKNRLLPNFKKDQLALNQRKQRIQGFMMPLQPGEKQTHFLLSSVPLTCSFCTPGGPESMVEVKSKTPVAYTLDPVTVEGIFAVLNDDAYGMFYRVTDAVPVK